MSRIEEPSRFEACQNRLGRNTILLAVGEIVARLLGAVSAALIARTFGPEGFGQLTLALALFFYFHLLSMFGLDVVGTRRVAALTHTGAETKQPVGGIIGLRLVTGIASFGLLLLSAMLVLDRSVGMLLLIYGLSCLVNAFLVDWYFIGTGRTGWVAAARITKQVVFFAGVVLTCIASRTLLWVPVAWVLADSAAALYLAVGTRRDPGRLRVAFDRRVSKNLLGSSWSIAASAILVAVIYRAGTLILAARCPGVEVGYYGAAFFLVMAAIMLVHAFGQSLFPVMCRHFAHGSLEELRRTLGSGLRFTTTFILPMSVGGVLVARPLIELIYGRAYLPAVPMFQVLMTAVFVIAVNTVVARGLWAVRKEKQYLVVVVFQGATTVLTAVLLVGRFRGVGAACSVLAGELTGLAGYAWCLSRVVRPPIERAHLSALAATAVMAAAVWTGLEKLGLSIWAVVPFAAVIFLGALVLLGGVPLSALRQVMPASVFPPYPAAPGGPRRPTKDTTGTDTRRSDGTDSGYESRVA